MGEGGEDSSRFHVVKIARAEKGDGGSGLLSPWRICPPPRPSHTQCTSYSIALDAHQYNQ